MTETGAGAPDGAFPPRKPWAGTPFEAEYEMLCAGIDRERERADAAERHAKAVESNSVRLLAKEIKHRERFRDQVLRLLSEGDGPGGGFYEVDQRLAAAVSLLQCGWGTVEPPAGPPDLSVRLAELEKEKLELVQALRAARPYLVRYLASFPRGNDVPLLAEIDAALASNASAAPAAPKSIP